jgi:hypothetical protein
MSPFFGCSFHLYHSISGPFLNGKTSLDCFISKNIIHIQSTSKNRTVRVSNGHFSDTFCVRISDAKNKMSAIVLLLQFYCGAGYNGHRLYNL